MAARKVRILRPDNLGDVVLFSGALRHVRSLYPEAHISFIGKRYALPLLEACPFVDERIPWEVFEETLPSPRYRPPGEGWWARRVRHARRRRDRRAWRRFCDRLACDVLLLPVRSPTPLMHQVVAAIPADEKIGIAGDSENQSKEEDAAAAASYTRRMELAPERRFAPELETTHAFLHFLGVEVLCGDVRPEVWTTDADRRRGREAVPRVAGAITIGIAPGRTEVHRLFPPEHYATALVAIDDPRHSVVLLGAPGEEELCDRVGAALRAQGFGGGILDLCGRLSIRELVEAIRRLDILVSLDSAPVHLGAALGKPVVGVRGGGHIGRFWPWGDPQLSRVAATELDCYGCNWVCVHDRVRCVEEIPVETLRARIEAAIACLPAAFEA